MSRRFVRFILSFSVILSLGYGQLYAAVSSGVNFLNSQSTDADEAEVDFGVYDLKTLSILKRDLGAERHVLDWESESLAEKTEEVPSKFDLELQLALTAVFLFLLSISLSAYHTRFLRFCKNFFYILPHRLHLINRIFTI